MFLSSMLLLGLIVIAELDIDSLTLVANGVHIGAPLFLSKIYLGMAGRFFLQIQLN